MTNRQWLESMSDRELALFLYGLEDYAHCDYCAHDGCCRGINQDCLGGTEKWLKQEHRRADDGNEND